MINYAKIIRETIKVCEEKTGVKCEVDIFINPKLTKSLGRSFARVKHNRYTGLKEYTPTKIEISKKFIEIATEQELIDVVKHEYAHTCSYLKIGNHSHDSGTFIRYCKLMDTTSSPKYSTESEIKLKYTVHCISCEKKVASYGKKGKVIKEIENGNCSYTSRCCGSKLKFTQNY